MTATVSDAEILLDRDVFLRELLRQLSGTLEQVVGIEAAEGYISTVGSQVGRWIDADYRNALDLRSLDHDQVAEVCVDLKARIGGDFYLVSADETKLVFGNRRCPFGDKVRDRPSLCMMTSNVFGRIAADNLGYARVELDETIAAGAPGCRVVVHLAPVMDVAPNEREYYRVLENDPETETGDSRTGAEATE